MISFGFECNMDLEDHLLLPCAIHRSVQATGKSVMSIELLSNIKESGTCRCLFLHIIKASRSSSVVGRFIFLTTCACARILSTSLAPGRSSLTSVLFLPHLPTLTVTPTWYSCIRKGHLPSLLVPRVVVVVVVRWNSSFFSIHVTQ